MMKGMFDRSDIIVIRRSDVQKLVDYPKPPRDQLIIELARCMGLRTGEISTLRWEHVDLDNMILFVDDSKRKELYPIPLAWQVEQLLRAKIKGPPRFTPKPGWVIRPFPAKGIRFSAIGQPFTCDAIQDVVKRYAQWCKIIDWRKWTPRLLRCCFAAEWYRQRRDMKVLKMILRHKDLATTFRYVNRIYFWEDVEHEFAKMRDTLDYMRFQNGSTAYIRE